MDEELIGIAAWNFKLLSAMRNSLWVKETNTGLAPIIKYQQKVRDALDFLENFEGLKHRTMINQLAKHANVCKAEIDQLNAIPVWKVWKTWGRNRRIQLLWISYNVYANAMSIIASTLPDDIKAILPPESQDQETPISKMSVSRPASEDDQLSDLSPI